MKLFIIHVGYYEYELGMYEHHTEFLIAAETASEAKKIVINKSIYKSKNMHIDGIQEVNQVDGFSITLVIKPNDIENKIYSHKEINAM